MYCYYGTVLYDEVLFVVYCNNFYFIFVNLQSNSIANAIYMGKWYKYDVKSRKALISIMEQSKKTITLTAGKVLEISVVTFTMVKLKFGKPSKYFLYCFRF